jgi:hypothetical protein
VVRTLFDYRDGGTYLLLLVVKGPVPNPELDDQISDLDMEVYRDFPEFPMSMMTVPSDRPGAVSAFVNPEGALVIYANTPRTPSRC